MIGWGPTMALLRKDVNSLSQARATLSGLSDQVAGGADRLAHYHQLEQDNIHRALITEVRKGLEDIANGYTANAETALDEMIRYHQQ